MNVYGLCTLSQFTIVYSLIVYLVDNILVLPFFPKQFYFTMFYCILPQNPSQLDPTPHLVLSLHWHKRLSVNKILAHILHSVYMTCKIHMSLQLNLKIICTVLPEQECCYIQYQHANDLVHRFSLKKEIILTGTSDTIWPNILLLVHQLK